MSVKIIIFDFDGTLIDSNQIKYDAFFELFPSDNLHKQILEDVLSEFVEESRYVILKEILKRVDDGDKNEVKIARKVEKLADSYNDLVLTGAKNCNDMPGAKTVLKALSSKYRLYLNSTTPEVSLKEIVRDRGWNEFFCDIFGHPNDKVSTILEIMRNESKSSYELLVVGDGESDKASARAAECGFFEISRVCHLKDLMDFLKDAKSGSRVD